MFDAVAERPGFGCAAVAIGGLGGVALICAGALASVALSEPSVAPPAPAGRPIPSADANVDGIALDRLHRELWTRWSIATRGPARTEAADAIAAALASDPALAAVAGQIVASADRG